MYLIVDCETNGLPRNWRAPVTDFANWPRAVQIAWALYDDQQVYMAGLIGFLKDVDAGRF